MFFLDGLTLNGGVARRNTGRLFLPPLSRGRWGDCIAVGLRCGDNVWLDLARRHSRLLLHGLLVLETLSLDRVAQLVDLLHVENVTFHTLMNETCLHVAHQSEEVPVPVPWKGETRPVIVVMPVCRTGVVAIRSRVQQLILPHERFD